jgi:LysM repeat protein
MARVIVILALMFLISAVIFGVTRKPVGTADAIETDGRTTVPLVELSDDEKSTVETSILNREDGSGVQTSAATAQEVMSGTIAGAAPSFTTVGVDHRGRASFTGTASPGDEVSIVRDGKVWGKAVTDASGSWGIDFKVPAVREDFDLHLSATRKSGAAVMGPQRALVSPATTSGGLPHITLMASELKTEPAGPAGEPEVGIIVESVVAGGKGQAKLVGKADPGATVKAWINDESAGEVSVDGEGHWALDIKNETSKAASGVRLVLYSSKGQELDKTDVPYKLAASVMAQDAQSGHATATATFTSAPLTVTPVTAATQRTVVKVRRGDSLWRIAKRHYGDGKKWKKIFKANKLKIGDPDLIFVGRTLIVPR